MEVRSECPVPLGLGAMLKIKYLQPVFCQRETGRSYQSNLRLYTTNVLRSFHSSLPFLIILANHSSPLQCRCKFYEPNAEESRSIKVTLSALFGSQLSNSYPFVRTRDSSFNVSKNRPYSQVLGANMIS